MHPIRRRRKSDPDYDVPRSHRSLQIIPRSPSEENDKNDIVIPATRFFGPVLSPEKGRVSENSIICRSITPDSLEPFNLYHNGTKSQRNRELNSTYIIEKNAHIITKNNDSFTTESSFTASSPKHDSQNETYIVDNYEIDELIGVESKQTENFLDSLEPFVEVSTAF